MSDDCIFCKIIKGEIPCDKIYEDEKMIAFKDINPKAPVHVLFVPKEHIPTVNDIKDFSIVSDIYKVIQKIAKEMNIAESGYRIVTNCQVEGGQEVFHLHLHMLGGRPLKGMC